MDRDTAISALDALGQPMRYDAMTLLATAGETGMTAGELAEQLGALPNTLSANLAVLLMAGLVTNLREGRQIRYRANVAQLRHLGEDLSTLAAGAARPDN